MVIRPIIRLLKVQKIILTADREFHSIFLSHWLKKYQTLDVYFVFRQKKSTMIKRGKKYCNLSELKVNVGQTKLFGSESRKCGNNKMNIAPLLWK